jgi:hypothetical protein
MAYDNYALTPQAIMATLNTPPTQFSVGNTYVASNNNNVFSSNPLGINIVGDTFSMLSGIDQQMAVLGQTAAIRQALGITSTNTNNNNNNSLMTQLFNLLKGLVNGEDVDPNVANLDEDTKEELEDTFKEVFGAGEISEESLEKYAEMVADGADMDEIEDEMRSVIKDSAAKGAASAAKGAANAAVGRGAHMDAVKAAYTSVFGSAPTNEQFKKYYNDFKSVEEIKAKMIADKA